MIPEFKKLFLILTLFFISPFPAYAGGLADSPWPMFHGGLSGSGLSKYDTSKVDGTVIWKFKTEGSVEVSPVLGSDGTIYIGDHKCNLYAINSDGSLKWKFNGGQPVHSTEWNDFSCLQSSPAVASDGTVYFAPMSGNLYAVDSQGKEKWRFPIRMFKTAWGAITIGPDGTIYIGTEMYPPYETGKPTEVKAGFYAINPNGTKKWVHEVEASAFQGTANLRSDGTIIVSGGGVCSGRCAAGIWAFDKAGQVLWTYVPEGKVIEGATAMAADGTIYFGTKDQFNRKTGRFYALTPEGKLKWSFDLDAGMSASPAIGKNGDIYFGDWDGTFYALSSLGKELWRDKTPAAYETLTSSPAIGADGTIYFGSTAGYFFAYTPNGKQKWQIKSEKSYGSFVSSPAIGKDGVVYAAEVPGELVAISSKDRELKKTSPFNFGGLKTGQQEFPDKRQGQFGPPPGYIGPPPGVLLSAVFLIITLTLITLIIKSDVKRRRKILAGAGIFLFSFILILTTLRTVGPEERNEGYKTYPNEKPREKSEDYIPGSSPVQPSSVQADQSCPSHVYGSEQNGFYGAFINSGGKPNERKLAPEEAKKIKDTCPNTTWPDSFKNITR